MAIDVTAIVITSEIQMFAGGKLCGFERKSFTRQNFPDSKSFRIQSSHFKFRIHNLRRHDQTGEFLFRIRSLVCKRQSQSGSEPFRTRHKSGTISPSVNLVSD